MSQSLAAAHATIHLRPSGPARRKPVFRFHACACIATRWVFLVWAALGVATSGVRSFGAEISITSASVREGNSGTVGAVFGIGLSEPLPTQITVDYDTVDGT